MKSRLPLLLLGVAGIAPLAVTAACGGKVLGGDTVGDQTVSPSAPGASGTGTGTSATATSAPPPGSRPSSGALAPCTADSTPLPLPASPDPVVVAQCQKFCERNYTCVGCIYGTCMPNCLSDAAPTRPSGAPYVAWMNCLLAHEVTCTGQPACDAEYCAYARANSSPSAPDPVECH